MICMRTVLYLDLHIVISKSEDVYINGYVNIKGGVFMYRYHLLHIYPINIYAHTEKYVYISIERLYIFDLMVDN